MLAPLSSDDRIRGWTPLDNERAVREIERAVERRCPTEEPGVARRVARAMWMDAAASMARQKGGASWYALSWVDRVAICSGVARRVLDRGHRLSVSNRALAETPAPMPMLRSVPRETTCPESRQVLLYDHRGEVVRVFRPQCAGRLSDGTTNNGAIVGFVPRGDTVIERLRARVGHQLALEGQVPSGREAETKAARIAETRDAHRV